MSFAELWPILTQGGGAGVLIVVFYLSMNGMLVWGPSHKAQVAQLKDEIDQLRKDRDQARTDSEGEMSGLRSDKELEIRRLLDRNTELWELLKLSHGLVRETKDTADQAVVDAERALQLARRTRPRTGS